MRAAEPSPQLGIFDQPIARRLRDDGIKRAADHADEIVDSWTAKALEALRGIAPRFLVFTASTVRQRAHMEGLPLPPDPRAWGSVFRGARKLGLIEFLRYVPDPDPSRHCGPTAEYRWVGQ